MADYNPRYRDSVFRSYFNEPARLLSLCNAVLDTNYTNPDELNINTLDGLFFDKQKNDISCSIDNHFLILVEHQTTVNENMPFRCLSYVAELLNNLIVDKDKLYHQTLIYFPSPRFVVLYNGDKHEPLQRKMRLSDSFYGDSSSIELIVSVYNINYGLPQPLLKKCSYLNDYSTLVGKVKEGINLGLSQHDAISRAVKFCIDNGLMKGYLEFNAQEVLNMLALEWNMDNALHARFQDGLQQGENLKAEAVAIKLIRRGRPLQEIQEDTDLPMERIHQLAKDYIGN